MTIQEKLYNSYLKYSLETAIINNTFTESYNKLFNKAFSISLFLSNTLNDSNKIVALIFTKSNYYIYSIIGILYSKNIFMPLDSSYPIEKLLNCLLSVNCNCLLTDKNIPKQILKRLRKEHIEVLFIENIIKAIDISSISFDFEKYQENDAIYVYFTSGTTGKPKAILGKNKSLLHFIEWEKSEFKVKSSDIFAQITSPAFDPYLRDIFTPLHSGAKIQLVNKNIILNSRLFGDFLNNSKITFLHLTPTIFNCLIKHTFQKNHFKRLKYLLISGEPLSPNSVKHWYSYYNQHTQIVNLYGPTEATLAKVFSVIPKNFNDIKTPVGKPINDTNIHIINNDNLTKCNTGEIGEVYIETEFMTHGYYDDKEIFCELPNSSNKCYATGDLGYIENGNLYLVGRKDYQLKINGVRINLNEIKIAVLSYIDIKIEDCAILYEDNLLICFYVSSAKLEIKDIRKYLEDYLLTSHIPKEFIKLKKLPITTNGKVDRKILKEIYISLNAS